MGKSRPVLSIYDLPLWESIRARRLALQCCSDCTKFWYPPAPLCPYCLSPRFTWEPISGSGEILSWVVFHRQYFDDFPVPYNVVAVQLSEGPIFTTNLIGDTPQDGWIGRRVKVEYQTKPDGDVLPVVSLS